MMGSVHGQKIRSGSWGQRWVSCLGQGAESVVFLLTTEGWHPQTRTEAPGRYHSLKETKALCCCPHTSHPFYISLDIILHWRSGIHWVVLSGVYVSGFKSSMAISEAGSRSAMPRTPHWPRSSHTSRLLEPAALDWEGHIKRANACLECQIPCLTTGLVLLFHGGEDQLPIALLISS